MAELDPGHSLGPRAMIITRRVALLSNQWQEFATKEHARMLCWRLATDEVRMVDAFLELQTDERTANHADLFVALEASFEFAPAHGSQLRDELVSQYEHDAEALRAQGLDASWTPPSAADSEPGVRFFVRSCASGKCTACWSPSPDQLGSIGTEQTQRGTANRSMFGFSKRWNAVRDGQVFEGASDGHCDGQPVRPRGTSLREPVEHWPGDIRTNRCAN